jgi:hypothetical protein
MPTCSCKRCRDRCNLPSGFRSRRVSSGWMSSVPAGALTLRFLTVSSTKSGASKLQERDPTHFPTFMGISRSSPGRAWARHAVGRREVLSESRMLESRLSGSIASLVSEPFLVRGSARCPAAKPSKARPSSAERAGSAPRPPQPLRWPTPATSVQP